MHVIFVIGQTARAFLRKVETATPIGRCAYPCAGHVQVADMAGRASQRSDGHPANRRS